jgi:hypothetical protein
MNIPICHDTFKNIKIIALVGGIHTPLNNMKVSWDDSSQLNGKKKHVPNHQPVAGYMNVFPFLSTPISNFHGVFANIFPTKNTCPLGDS